MKINNIKNQCTGCMACYNICPVQCITYVYDKEGFYFPNINKSQCLKCRKCENVCHILNPLNKDNNFQRCSFYGKSKDISVLRKSTSGGAFFHLAKSIVAEGGNVYGAYFDLKARNLRHECSDRVGIEGLLKSKYIESEMGDTISAIQRDVNVGRKVLFCGTPCQVSGVKKAIKDVEGLLITVDFVCHGVPSSRIFKEHLYNIIGNKALKKIDFRPKENGWASKNICLVTNKTTTTPYYLDPFYSGFITYNAFLRPSCYNCIFKQQHYSDITIADFWGYKAVEPNMYVDEGVSLIIVNTEKGLSIIKNIESEFDIQKIDNKYSDYVFEKRDYSNHLTLRDEFYKLYFKKHFKYAASKTYMKGIWKKKMKFKVKKLIGRE